MKTHKSAVVIIPPEEIWEPIQKIRRLYDRQCHRWMPHITLIYPFRPRSELERAVAVLSSGITALRAFALRLHRLQYFTHDRDRFTMWLDPGPREPIAALQARSRRRCPTATTYRSFREASRRTSVSARPRDVASSRSEPAVFRTNGSPSSSPLRTWPSSAATTTGRSALNE